MKTIVYLLSIVIIISFSCNSSKKALQKGNYNKAFYKSVKKLQKKPTDQEQAEIFTISYRKANQQDLDRINFLKTSNEKKIWPEVYKKYMTLSNRQRTAETVLPLRVGGKTINFKHIDYNSNIIEAKNKAAEYHYRKGLELMMGDKLSIRNAYNQFAQVKVYSGSYSDIDQLMKQALEKGTSHVFIEPINKSNNTIEIKHLLNLTDFGMQDLDKQWVKYYNNKQKANYDFNIYVSVTNLEIGQNKLKETKETISKKVEDGWRYVLDASGNVKKDSLGNDIKEPKYKTISCELTKKIQQKLSSINIKIEYQDNKTKRIIATSPLSTKFEFYYISSYANGDLNALDENTKKTIGKDVVSFPEESFVIQKLTDNLKPKIKANIKSNGYRIK